MGIKEMNVLVLAYLGDTIYEQFVRRYFIEKGTYHVKDLQNQVIPYVQARGQASFLEQLLERNFFTEEEMNVIFRARNAKGHGHPKSCDILTYKHATALEAVFGYWGMYDQTNRMKSAMKIILEELSC